MFTQNLTRIADQASSGLRPGRPAHRSARRRPLHRAGGPDLDAGRGPRQGHRRAPDHAAQRHPHAGPELSASRPPTPSRPVSTSTSPSRSTGAGTPAAIHRPTPKARAKLELTIGHHDGGLVSNYLYERARRGMVVGLAGVGGDFVLPAEAAAPDPVRLRRKRHHARHGDAAHPRRRAPRRAPGAEIAFVHYARTAAEACYRDELAALPGVRVLHGYTRSDAGDLAGRFGPEHLAAAMPSPDAVFVCGPTALVEAVREHCDNVYTESFVPPALEAPAKPSGGRITFADSGIDVVDDGRLAAGAGRIGRPDAR